MNRPRVLVVDDSAFMRKLISELVESTNEFAVAGVAKNGVECLQKVRDEHPDIVTLDIAMPVMDGLSALQEIMRTMPRPVVMLSAAASSKGRDMTIRALELGAVDFVKKPSGPISVDLARIGERLIHALRSAAASRVGAPSVFARPSRRTPHRLVPGRSERCDRVVVIAASTGGPRALAEIIPRLRADIGAAILVVQHMPQEFTGPLAQRLDLTSLLRVAEAREGEPLTPNRVYVAPGGLHMTVERAETGPIVRLQRGPTVWGVRPAADPLLSSVADVFGAAAIGVILTGMGHDGSQGLKALRRAGGIGIVQDEASSLIYGMPQAALAAAGADCIVSLGEMAGRIGEEVGRMKRGN
jgi:two-component system chemotaxis response regulator CheB